jgi:hypothetical protein
LKANPAITPDSDLVFPGENWFYYWKTSASLWKDKIEQVPAYEKIIIPINWSFHSETGDDYDFGTLRPETDIFRLVSQVNEHNRTPVLLLPLTPAPFLPNGGVPSFLARIPSVDEEKMPIWALGASGEINKMFSFFDQRIFKGFSRFTKELGQYLSAKGVNCDVWGIDCGSLNSGSFRSFFYDRSEAYTSAFQNFLHANEESADLTEFQNHHDFYQTIWTLYNDCASKNLSANWEGMFKVSFLGGGQVDNFDRVCEVDSKSHYSFDIMECVTFDVLSSSTLIKPSRKSGIVQTMLEDLVTKSMLEQKLSKEIYEDDGAGFFYPLRFFEVYDIDDLIYPESIMWADLGLWDFLQHKFNWCFADKGNEEYVFNESLDYENTIFFFHGMGMTKKLFNNVLRTFMAGGKIIFNRSGLEATLLKRLETFFLENSLNVEKIKSQCTVHNVVLGEGRLVVIDGDELADCTVEDMSKFWQKLISTFVVKHLPVNYIEGLHCNWRSRPSDYKELEYEEIRRLSIYNPTNYKKKLRLDLKTGFNLLKILDDKNVKFNTTHNLVEVEFLPEGKVSMDFGVYS